MTHRTAAELPIDVATAPLTVGALIAELRGLDPELEVQYANDFEYEYDGFSNLFWRVFWDQTVGELITSLGRFDRDRVLLIEEFADDDENGGLMRRHVEAVSVDFFFGGTDCVYVDLRGRDPIFSSDDAPTVTFKRTEPSPDDWT